MFACKHACVCMLQTPELCSAALQVVLTVLLLLCDRDNPDVDIVSANMYRRYVQSLHGDENGNTEQTKALPMSRMLPTGAKFMPQTVTHSEGILVGTGIYNPLSKRSVSHTHEAFPLDRELVKPSVFKPTCFDAMHHIFVKEGLLPSAAADTHA